MSESSKIEWTDATWNVTIGCDRVSPGCDGCYAIRQARMRASNPNPKVAAAFAGTVDRDEEGRLDWTGRVNLLPERLDQPLRWRKPRRIFVDSLSDLFHADVPDEFVAHAFAVMAATPHHTYQVLTKRTARLRTLLSRPTFAEDVDRELYESLDLHPDYLDTIGRRPWPLPNVWIGTSVEDQKRADLRIPALLETPAAVRWLSCEPLLGPVTLAPWTVPDGSGTAPCIPGLHWVVSGGESGPGARPMHPDWARGLRDECFAADVAYHFKQWGEWAPLSVQDDPAFRSETDHDVRADGYNWPISQPHGAEDGSEVIVRRFGKSGSGRELDGRTWDEFPMMAVTA